MVSVKEATSIILSNPFNPTTIQVEISECLGRFLAETIFADRDFPPFDRATMDGIALACASHQHRQLVFPIESVQAAGEPRKKLNNSNSCIEIMTGAMLPDGTDTIIPYEKIEIDNGQAVIKEKHIAKGQNIHNQGCDAKENDVLLNVGTRISPAEVALLASVGKTSVTVFCQPKIAIVSTGNELIEIDQIPAPHQIRRSNSYALQAALLELNMISELQHFDDDADVVKAKTKILLNNVDVILLSGGVSKGKFDFVPSALESLGVEKLFHGVSQKPGKPMWFGKIGNKFVFALPGNPVSTFLCFHRYVKPWLLQSMGAMPSASTAILSENFSFNGSLTYFLQTKIKNIDGRLTATPMAGGGSGDFVNLKEVDGFLELPNGRSEFKAGDTFAIWRFR